MPDYDLTRLGSRAFEQLVVSLGRCELGPGMSVFGDGPDGGREATFDGTIVWSNTVCSNEAAPEGEFDERRGRPQSTSGGDDPMTAVDVTEPRSSHLNSQDEYPQNAVPTVTSDDVWPGYTVLQSKFRLDPSSRPHDNAQWLQQQIKSEIDRWIQAAKKRTRERLPDYLIFVTNLSLSAVARTGGIDTLNSFVARLLAPDSAAVKARLKVRGFKVWHADQVRSMLDAHQDVRWAFPGLLTVGDVIAVAHEHRRVTLGTNTIEDPLRQHLLSGLSTDRCVRLGQAGASGNERLDLDDVAIDLPATVSPVAPYGLTQVQVPTSASASRISISALQQDSFGQQLTVSGGDFVPVSLATVAGTADALSTVMRQTVQAAAHVLTRGDTNLSARQEQRVGRPGLVLVGGPGQGKTTLSQLIAQSYRAAILADVNVAPEARGAIDATNRTLSRLGLHLPGNRRWPIRVDLAKYAEELASGSDVSLLRWIARLVGRRADVDVTAQQMNSWLGMWPWAVILDGLDEVPSLDSRRAVYTQIDEFWVRVDDIGADVLLIVTTRPVGYDEQLPQDRFEHLYLKPLPPKESAALAWRLTAKRLESDPELRSAMSLHGWSRQHRTQPPLGLWRRRCRSPIMSLIVERFPTLPPDRFTLFDLYYRTVFEREAAKPIAVARFLLDHRQHVDRLHEQVGLVLQVQSEEAHGADAVLDPTVLQSIATEHLLDRGYGAEDALRTAQMIVEAATHRLVLLTPRGAGLGFEIRTLQEMMAARAIAAGTDDAVERRLILLAHNSHWRNTWLLTAGKLLVADDRFEDLLTRVLQSLSHGPMTVGERVSPAPSLAAELLSDGLANRRPKFERALARTVLSAVQFAPVGQLRSLALALNTLMDGAYRQLVVNHLEAAAGIAERASTAALLDAMDEVAGIDHHARHQSIHRMGDHLGLTSAEVTALRAFLSASRKVVTTVKATDGVVSFTQFRSSGSWNLDSQPKMQRSSVSRRLSSSVARATTSGPSEKKPESSAESSAIKPIREALEDLGLGAEALAAVSETLSVLGTSSFVLSKTHPPLAVLQDTELRDPDVLPDKFADDEVATAMDLALGSLPPGLWAIPALLAEALHLTMSRRPVGADLLSQIARDKQT